MKASDTRRRAVEFLAATVSRLRAIAPFPRSLAEAQTGGRGIRLVRHYADQIRYERRGDVTSNARNNQAT